MKALFLVIKGIDPQYNTDGILIGYKSYEWTMKPEYTATNDGSVIMDYILQVRNIIGYVLEIKGYMTEITPYITLSTSCMYMIGAIYRLMFLW